MNHRAAAAANGRRPQPMLRIALALLALLALSACVSSNARDVRQLRRAVATLERSSNPDALAAAALSEMIGRPSEPHHGYAVAFDLAGRAVALAPHRPDLLWLQIQLCGQIAGCRSEALEERLQVLDPKNGAGWLGALARAQAAHDEVALGAAIAAIGSTDHVDIYWNSLAGNLSKALASSHEISLSMAVVTVIGELSAIAIPAFQSATRACKGEERPKALRDCRAFAAAFQGGDTYITSLIGDAIARQVWPVDSSEAIATRDARRVAYYRIETWGRVVEADLRSDAGAHRFIRALLEHRSEQDVDREGLLASHLPLDPPPGWVGLTGQ